MADMVRKCTQCGAVDRRFSWKSVADASGDAEYERPWTCSSCAWTEFELVSGEGGGTSASGAAAEGASGT